jgi:hypothetical protein
MDSVTIFSALKQVVRNTNVKRAYLLSADELHLLRFNHFPIVVILHNKPKAIIHGHWLSFFIYKIKNTTIVDYWDSYGLDLSDYGIVFPIKVNNINKKVIQCSDSHTCGLHALWFVYHRVRNTSLTKISQMFSTDCKRNDKLVEKFFSRIIRACPRNSNNFCVTMKENVDELI